MKFLLYGANVHTATFAIEYAKEQGINLILAGRSEESIKPLAEENGFDYRIFNLESNIVIKMPSIFNSGFKFFWINLIVLSNWDNPSKA